ncbi:MAG: hypothetical protein ACRC7G_14170, partial [Beijerinckiaceae bacterium]
ALPQTAESSAEAGEVTDIPSETAQKSGIAGRMDEVYVAVQKTSDESSVYDFSRRRHGGALPT